MRHAATQWAAPTAEQPALVGTHWSKGWIIENNIISDSKCVGITLGKDKASGHNELESAPAYNVVIKRALENGWSKEKIGSHIVRKNTIHDCGSAGICGSMGCAFSEILDNHIYNIHIDKPYSGAEMGGIKFHAPIDTLIRKNRIHNCHIGLWMDWMTQGTRIDRNVLYDNVVEDLFVEVNHGPYVVTNNLFLSKHSLVDWSQGGAFAHNLFGGDIARQTEERVTPYHEEHGTTIAGMSKIYAGDNRFYNNIFAGIEDLSQYNDAEKPIYAPGNLYLSISRPFASEVDQSLFSGNESIIQIIRENETISLKLSLPALEVSPQKYSVVTTHLLGVNITTGLHFKDYDQMKLEVSNDYFGNERDHKRAVPGPFASREITQDEIEL